MLDPDDPVVRAAVFGKQVEMFRDSDIGRYVVRKAERESDQAMSDLLSADPFDPAAVARHQHKAKVANAVVQWLEEAIEAGYSATEVIKEEQR